MIFIYITNPTKKIAKKISKHLLKERLIACANIYESESLYWWKNKITEDNEFTIIAKTTEDKFEKVKKEVKKIHPYKVPCIVKIPVSPNKEYLDWLKKEVK